APSARRRRAYPEPRPGGLEGDLPVVLGGGLMSHPRLRDAAVIATGGALPGREVLGLTGPAGAGAGRRAGAAPGSATASSLPVSGSQRGQRRADHATGLGERLPGGVRAG